MRKIFWALFVVGCGIHVHGVEKTAGKEKSILRKKNNVPIVNAPLEVRDDLEMTQGGVRKAFHRALEANNVNLMKELLRLDGELRIPQWQVSDYFESASKDGSVKRMKPLIELVRDQRRVSQDDVISALDRAVRKAQTDVLEYLIPLMTQLKVRDADKVLDVDLVLYILSKAKNDAVIDLFIKDESIMQILDSELRKFAGGDRPVTPTNQHVQNLFPPIHPDRLSDLGAKSTQRIPDLNDFFNKRTELTVPIDQYYRYDGGLFRIGPQHAYVTQHLSERVIKRMVVGPDGPDAEQCYSHGMALMKLRQKGTTKVSKLPEGVFRRVLEHCIDIDPQFSAESSDGKLIIPRKELAGEIWVQLRKLSGK